MNYYLGVDGGQSHTTALVADGRGRILGRGQAGPSNHTREPGGPERLKDAITQAVGAALQQADLLKRKTLGEFRFASAHLALCGEPEYKIEIVQALLRAENLIVGHDAPGALAGAFAGGDGIIVLAGTGSVACGEAATGVGQRTFVRVGGHGYMFGDEGSAFAIARGALANALTLQDYGAENELQAALLKHFRRPNLKAIAEDFYAGELSRDRIASFAARVGKLAEQGDDLACGLIDKAAYELARMAMVIARQLGLTQKLVNISYGGGVFNSRRLLARFAAEITIELPHSRIIAPRFGPEVGALLLAYRQAGKKINVALLANITETQR
jgi:N-acetylglucosamine kinase-like BadF-type ATPase